MTSHKNKIKVSLMALLFASNLYTQAQTATPYSISGVLCDSTTHQAEAFATVRLLQLPTKKPVRLCSRRLTDLSASQLHEQDATYSR